MYLKKILKEKFLMKNIYRLFVALILLCSSQVECVTGVVLWYNDQKGYGFIKVDHTNQVVFVTVANIAIKTLYEDEKVEFDIVKSGKGVQAIHVRHVPGDG